MMITTRQQNRVISAAAVVLLTLLLPTLMATATATATTDHSLWPIETYVKLWIKNEIGGGRPPLIIHCRSRDDDLNVHVVKPHETYRFRILPNIFGTTMFYCSMDWGTGLHWFDIYDQDRDMRRCRTYCTWIVKETGPCLTNGEFTACYQWKN
ncbi:unnamed protein product [Linum tenue]|uniref:S-protein homolog n=1 Tax=Linum tenue TaxID=586396 RepID=A0AAV0R7W7_9ROSI|nr:unnamed protein product [Linum tenue]